MFPEYCVRNYTIKAYFIYLFDNDRWNLGSVTVHLVSFYFTSHRGFAWYGVLRARVSNIGPTYEREIATTFQKRPKPFNNK